MKTFVLSLMTALLIAVLLFTPVAAASAPAGLASEDCGDTYVVQYLDYLAKIAKNCGTSVANILALNPQIINANLIYPGQVLRLTGSAPVITTTPTPTPTYTYPRYTWVSLSTTWARAGSAVTVYASGFPASTEIDFRVGRRGESFSVAYDGTTSASGTASQVITIPTDASQGEYWTVEVVTTSLPTVTSRISAAIYIGTASTYVTYTGYARVSLSATRAAPGGTVTVYVNGFPAGAEIDYRLGVKGADFSVVYDGTTSASGTASQTVTIPSDATVGTYWVVKVVTTSLKDVTEVTSHTIYITN